jgi:hypothetical protein
MSRRAWFILFAAIFALGAIAVAFVLIIALAFFIGHRHSTVNLSRLPVYTLEQSASSPAGYRHTTLTSGNEIYVSDYEEAALQLINGDPKTIIGRIGTVSDAKACAIEGQPLTGYIAGDCGSEMPAYVPYRNIKQPPFDWRTASFREMTAWRVSQHPHNPYLTTSNAALIAEVVRVLRDDAPVDLGGISFAAGTNLAAIKMTCDQLPGLLFCPAIYYRGNGAIYLAESLTMDWTAKPGEIHARWIPAGAMLTEWLKSP